LTGGGTILSQLRHHGYLGGPSLSMRRGSAVDLSPASAAPPAAASLRLTVAARWMIGAAARGSLGEVYGEKIVKVMNLASTPAVR
jgi:hypothetical protein